MLSQDALENEKLLAVDFDKTIPNEHIHNILAKKKIIPVHGKLIKQPFVYNAAEMPVIDDLEKEVYQILDESGFKNGEQMLHHLREALEKGIHVVIASYTHYPEVIPIALSRLGLEKGEISQITIIGGFPKNMPFSGKEEHIQLAKEVCGCSDIPPWNICLMDDSPRNINKAVMAGYKVVEVPAEPNSSPVYFDELKQFIDQQVKAYEIDNMGGGYDSEEEDLSQPTYPQASTTEPEEQEISDIEDEEQVFSESSDMSPASSSSAKKDKSAPMTLRFSEESPPSSKTVNANRQDEEEKVYLSKSPKKGN